MAEGAASLEIGVGERFKEFLENFRDQSGRLKYLEEIRRMIDFERTSITVDFRDLYRYDSLMADLLLERPREFIKEAGQAIKEIVAVESPEYAEGRSFTPRFVGLFDTTRIRDIGSDHVGKLVQVEGIVTRMHPRATRMIRAVFRHEKCGAEFRWPLDENEILGEKVERPGICPVCGEAGGKFALVREKSEFIDWQKIVVQERPEDVPGGQIPRSIEVHLTRDLVESVRPGDRIKIVGIVGLEQYGATSTLYGLHMEANSIMLEEKILEEVSITKEDEVKILELARDPWIKEKIISSIAPTIYGHWDLKEAIALLLFGGVPKSRPDGTRARGDIHVLFVGDPGVAKSLTYSEHILVVEEDGTLSARPIGELVDEYMDRYKDLVDRSGDTEQLLLEKVGVEIYAVSISPETLRPEIKRIKALIRHEAPRKVVIARTRSGREALITSNHSLIGLDERSQSLVAVEPLKALSKRILVPGIADLSSSGRKVVETSVIGGRRLRLDWELGFLLGVLVGRGDLVSRGPVEAVEVKVDDAVTAEAISHILRELGFQHKVSEGEGESYSITVEDGSLVEWFKDECLRKPGESGNSSGELEKVVPKIAYKAPKEFISGFISAFTSASEKGSTLLVEVKGRFLARGLSTLLALLGVGYSVDKAPSTGIGVSYRFRVFGKPGCEANGEVKENKYDILSPAATGTLGSLVSVACWEAAYPGDSSTLFWEPIVEVEEVEISEIEPENNRYVYDISVEDNENFAGGLGLIFLHNSQLLQSASIIAPRVVYTTGKGSTAAGLTAAVLRDSRTGEYYLEAGALVLADGGVAVIDEFDKMSRDDRGVIHEAMEQQTVSIAKAGIKATLSARASILAAGNPKLGYYDPSKSFVDNVDLPAPIISRFDLIFVVRDVIDKARDEMLASYVLEAHTNMEKFRPEIEPELLRKYIAYARKYVRPRLTPQAKKLLKEFYVEMRNTALHYSSQEGAKPIPITTRQLEALIRLTEAHARMALKHEATEEDAIAAIRLMLSVLSSIGLDLETGSIDVGIIMTGASFHTRKVMSLLLDIIRELVEGEGKQCARASEIEKIASERYKVPKEKVGDALQKLYTNGMIIQVRTDCFKAV